MRAFQKEAGVALPEPVLKFLLLLEKGVRKKAWIKNTVVFIPIFFHSHITLNLIISYSILFFSFCMVASGIYIFNDAVDLENDRLHPVKKNRIQVVTVFSKWEVGCSILLLFSMTTLGLVQIFSEKIALCFLFYVLLNFLYTVLFKHVRWLDITCLSLFFLLRFYSGSFLITDYPRLDVTLVFFILFFSLAFFKRITEVLYFIILELDIKNLKRPYDSDSLIYKIAMFINQKLPFLSALFSEKANPNAETQ